MTARRRDIDEAIPQRIRRAFQGLRVEGTGPGKEAAAVGLGLFLGCLPFYGFHLLLCWIFGSLFRLNRLKVYLAANISNPLVAPWLIFVELQAGAWLRHGAFQRFTPHAIRTAGIDVVLLDLLAGSLVIGIVLAVIAASATYAMLRTSTNDAAFVELVRRASDRYVGRSIVAWEFARGKLRGDPIYRAALCGGLLPSGGTLMDVGCGQGLMLALFAEARRAVDLDVWPASLPSPPRFGRMIGVEIRTRAAFSAQAALGADAEIVQGDASSLQIDGVRAVLLFDVLHMMGREEQDAMLDGMASRIDRHGVVLVREADASGGWRFMAVRLGNRLKAVAFGAWRQRFHFRTRAEWLACFAEHGFQAEVRRMGEGTPFANLLFHLTVKRHVGTEERQSADEESACASQ
jgi:uncharacterized protein (DUF2062 family)